MNLSQISNYHKQFSDHHKCFKYLEKKFQNSTFAKKLIMNNRKYRWKKGIFK